MKHFELKLFLVILSLGNVGCTRSATKSTAIATHILVKRAVLEDRASFRGIVRSANRIEMRTERKIKIAKVTAKNFQSVKKGDLLIEVDRKEAESKKLELLDKMQSLNLEMQSSNIKSQHAFKVLNRKKSLLQKGIIAQKEHDEALKDYQLSDSDLKSKQLEKEKCERELSEVEEQLKTANFYSPMDGTVSSLVAPETTDELNAGQLLAIISDPKNLALWIEVDETQIHRLRVGSLAKITLDSNRGQSIEGRVSEVSLGSSEKEGTRLKTYDVSTRFDPKGQNIREGFSGQAEFVFARRENTLSIPLAAIRYMDGKELVVVAHDDRSMGTPKEVKFGLKTDVEAEVVSGLMENDYVVIE